ncbi:MAG: 23S rRNA (pseudouridine(1915)-N(3))-methyltransferase RlmH [Eubacteriales bacterium]|nr:23S rRNA (pseudouridine(1915)-N(3))-methyltransferase RlmH [Eubacteriales bacterium]
MPHIDIIAVGRLREPFYRDAAAEYEKRLGRYARIHICEAEEVRKPDSVSETQRRQILAKEAERLRKYYKDGAYRIVLAIDGQSLDSVAFSEKMQSVLLGGNDTIQFVIGGAIGLDETLTREADLRLSFSKMTFPHQLMRVILLEQVYRAFRIMQNEPYHK